MIRRDGAKPTEQEVRSLLTPYGALEAVWEPRGDGGRTLPGELERGCLARFANVGCFNKAMVSERSRAMQRKPP